LSQPPNESWLVRPSTIKLLWVVFITVLGLTVLAQFVIKVKGYFVIDGWFGFGALFGFLACVAMVLVAKLLGRFLKRDEDYYLRRDEPYRNESENHDG
jgi:hypothetical protein